MRASGLQESAVKVLIVEDDPEAIEILTFILARAGFQAVAAPGTPTALRLVTIERPALVLLDVNLGHWNGFDLLRSLRERSDVPVILLTGRAAEEDRVHGLELGADDYITKPYSPRELVARIRAVLRRYGREAPVPANGGSRRLEVGPLALDLDSHSATLHGQRLHLTVLEFRLLYYLMRRAGTVVPVSELFVQVWGRDRVPAAETYRSTVHRLRQKLGDSAERPRLLHTVHGVGLMLRPTDPSSLSSEPGR